MQSREQPLLMICNTQRDRASRLPYQHATGHHNESRFVSVCMYLFICVSLLAGVQHMKQRGGVSWRALFFYGHVIWDMTFGRSTVIDHAL